MNNCPDRDYYPPSSESQRISPAWPAASEVQLHRLARAIRAGDRYRIDSVALLPEIARTAANLDTVIEHFEQHVIVAHRQRRGQPTVRTVAGGQASATAGITDPDTRRALLDREELLDRAPQQRQTAGRPRVQQPVIRTRARTAQPNRDPSGIGR